MAGLSDIGKALVPPGIDPTVMWRMTVSGTLFVLVVYMVWGLGLFGWANFPGLARAEDVSKVLTELKDQRIERLEAKILRDQRDFCAAPQDSKPREFYLTQRNESLNQYVKITGNRYAGMPSCAEL